MGVIDRQHIAGIGGKRGRVGFSESVQRRVIERGFESGQFGRCHGLPQRAAIAEIEVETTAAEHGEITRQRRGGIVTLQQHQCSQRVTCGWGRFTATGGKSEEEEHNRDTGQLQSGLLPQIHSFWGASIPQSCGYAPARSLYHPRTQAAASQYRVVASPLY